MKKAKILQLICILAFGTVALGLLVFYIINNPSENQTESIRQQYYELVKTSDSQNEAAKGYSKIFKKISIGNDAFTNEYAELFEEITNIPLGEDKSQVFSIAKEYSVVYKKLSAGFDDFGVSNLKIDEKSSNEFTLVFEQSAISEYSVEQINTDEPMYIGGEKPVKKDESLGENVILVTFKDEGFTDDFIKRYPIGETCILNNVPDALKSKIQIRRASIIDESTVGVYICSDEAIFTEEQINTKVIRPLSDIEIALSIDVSSQQQEEPQAKAE